MISFNVNERRYEVDVPVETEKSPDGSLSSSHGTRIPENR